MSLKVYRDIEIRKHKQAWLLGHKIRKVWEYEPDIVFEGPVEVDEMFPDGIVKNYSNEKRARRLEDLALQGKSPHGRQGDETCIAGMFDRATKRDCFSFSMRSRKVAVSPSETETTGASIASSSLSWCNPMRACLPW